VTAPREAVVVLKPRRAKPFFLRHPWVFSGSVAELRGEATKGGIAAVRDASGRFVGRGFYNPDSQIRVRLFTWDEARAIDADFWRARLRAAVRLRTEVLRLPEVTDAYRLVFSEGDLLPGLIVDRYADVLVVQVLSAGVAARRELFLDLLMDATKPRGILERSEGDALAEEKLAPARGLVRGEAPEGPITIASDGLRFRVDPLHGQKTGFYLDQRENRLAAAPLMRGRRVLDAFTCTGGFAIAAEKLGGAAEVLAVDRSAASLEMARRNAALNGCERIAFRRAKVAEALRELKASGRRFDAIVLDPPKFARSRPGVPRALRAYRDINLLALQLLEADGVLVTCSCSGHVTPEAFADTLNAAAVEAGRRVQLLARRGQSADHPVAASCRESAYLKCLLCRVAAP
jgi:23S rRNA (cytosine1962-C5)-methyltransferase